MIQSLFILSSTGEVLIERHFRGIVTSRSVCDYFWDRASISINHHGGLSTTTSLLNNEEQQFLTPIHNTIVPVMEVPESDHGTVYIVSILNDGLSYLAVVPAEVSPLMIIEFLHRIANMFIDYFGSPADESAIKDNFSTVYQLLEEMVDYGWPLTTEPNALQAMIRPPSVIAKLQSVVFANSTTNTVSDALPSGTVSNMPWRAAGVSYTQNEIYMDIVESIDAIVDATTGNVISSDVSGSIQCQCHLSGIPDLLLTFQDPTIIDDSSFHPCVRYARFERDSVVSFVPPDGQFELMRYSIDAKKRSHFVPPLDCHAQWTSSNNNNTKNDKSTSSTDNTSSSTTKTNDNEELSARLLVTVRVKSLSSLIVSSSAGGSGGASSSTGGVTSGVGMALGRHSSVPIEDVAVTIPLPKQVRTASFQISSGSIVYDEAGKVAKWTIGTIGQESSSSLRRHQLTAILKLHPPMKKLTKLKNDNNKKLVVPKSIIYYTNDGTTIDDSFDDIYNNEDEDEIITAPNLSLHWKIPLTSVSGLSVSGLSLTGESYRPYKGVRNITKSGLFQIRYS